MQAQVYILGSIAGLILCASGCAALLGLDEFADQSPGGSGAGGVVGAGGAGGAGGGAEPTPCTPDASEACYGGPPVTRNEGICREGVRACSADGTWGVCEGEILPAVERCDAADDENCDGLECVVWTTAFKQTDDVHFMAIAGDADGNVFVSGALLGTITIGDDTPSAASLTDALLFKLNAAGEPLWVKKFGDYYGDDPFALAVDAKGNPILGGYSDRGIDFGDGPRPEGGFIAKLDPSGKHIWSKGLGDGGIYAIATDANDAVVVAGTFSSSIDFGGGPIQSDGGMNIFVAKLDGLTGLVTEPGCWARTLGGGGASVSATAVAVDRSNNIFVAGSTFGTVTVGGFTIDRGSFVMKLTPSGVPVWVVRMPAPIVPTQTSVNVGGLTVDASGRPVLAGDYQGELQIGPHTMTSVDDDAFVVQIEANGTVGWVSTVGGTGGQRARGIALDPAGDFVVIGTAHEQIDFGNGPLALANDSGFVVKLSPDAELVWNRLLGKDAVPYDVAVSPRGETLVAGWTGAPEADWGAGPIPGLGGDSHQHLVVAKLGR